MGYTTVKQSSEFYMVERKSEFIGYCAPVTTEEEAIAFVNSIKKKHQKKSKTGLRKIITIDAESETILRLNRVFLVTAF